MGLTSGSGPFGERPAGRFNFTPDPPTGSVLYFDPVPYRGLPARFYLPAEDVRMDLLEPSETKTLCAYKGVASYWHVRVGDTLHEDLAWTYPDPEHDGSAIRDLICFFNERVDLEVDREPQERPVTQWSR